MKWFALLLRAPTIVKEVGEFLPAVINVVDEAKKVAEPDSELGKALVSADRELDDVVRVVGDALGKSYTRQGLDG